MRLLVLTLALVIAACGGRSVAAPSPNSTAEPTSVETPVAVPPTAATATLPPAPAATLEPTPTVTPQAPPTVAPTPSATPVPIHHLPPYVIAIDAGHGGPHYWGASARDADNNLWIEKDLTLAVAKRVQELLSDAGYTSLLIRSDDSTLTAWDASAYRASMIAEMQARVDRANALAADVLLSIHFNGWADTSQRGTETYCNPDRSFGNESCQLAWFVQDNIHRRIWETGYDVKNRGVKNDREVNGDPRNPHSFALGTNANFSPSLMPGVIAEVLFLSNPDDLAFLRREDAIDVIAGGFLDGLNAYFAWLNGG